MPIFSRFLADASPSYLFPVTYYLPDDTMCAVDTRPALTEQLHGREQARDALRLAQQQGDSSPEPDRADQLCVESSELLRLLAPSDPVGRGLQNHRVTQLTTPDPWTAASALLPYTPENDYTPEILVRGRCQLALTLQFCGGSNTDDEAPPKSMTSQMATVGFCQRMRLNDYGIKQGWQTEGMPSPRFMGEAIILPDGKLMLVNGAKTGVSGFNNIGSMTGNSNADNPVLQPWIYDPLATRGSRFSRTGMPTSKIPRMYHSTATVRAQASPTALALPSA